MKIRSPHLWTVLLLLVAVTSGTLRADVFIAEFDAINIATAKDADGSSSDWIELRNSGGSSVNLNGWALTDDPLVPGKWTFPNVTIGANAQLLVFASAKNRA